MVTESAENVRSETSAGAGGALHGEERQSAVDFLLREVGWRGVAELSHQEQLLSYSFQQGFRSCDANAAPVAWSLGPTESNTCGRQRSAWRETR